MNFVILGFFKYYNFFVQSSINVLETFGLSPNIPILKIVLPVGISFYTFQKLAYTIDVYRGSQKPTQDILSFAVYVAYFPQLVAGPIERSQRLFPQICHERRVTLNQFYSGCQLILMGYFKKIVIADGLITPVGICFETPQVMVGGVALYMGLWLFALQIYCDFSGYTDIARGVSRLFGIELGINFRQPYFSASITEFWRRWHISLSTWLRDYLYISLGGNRKGKIRTYINLMFTMVLGGLWHGASWTFVLWGTLHGVYLMLHRIISSLMIGNRSRSGFHERLKKIMGIALTFNLVCIARLFFRAQSWDQAMNYLHWMLVPTLGKIDHVGFYLLFYGILWYLLDFSCALRKEELPFSSKWPWSMRGIVYGAMLSIMLLIGDSNALPFICFQF